MYDHQKIEQKWQKYWQKEKLYSPDLDKSENPYYNLMMFPYPSAEGLHIGNMYAFTHSDCWGRYMRLKGYEVFEPIGLDGFGIHSENFAMKIKEHIRDVSKRTEKRFYNQLHMIGNQYDWQRTVETYKPNYYKWTQWLFLKMYQKGLAYRKESPVNWCPDCKTVLSDEQVISGQCERCDSPVEKKMMKQWFFKITDYAERLLKNLKEKDPNKKMDWSEDVKMGQINWIGKTEGIEIAYQIKDSKEKITCFTSYPETNYGATFVVLSPEHPKALKIVADRYKDKVKAYIQKAREKSDLERIAHGRKKTGVFTGRYCINVLTGYEMPIYIADFVLADVGTGAVVGVPGHDLRDYQFAQKFDLEIKRVMKTYSGDKSEINEEKKVNHQGIMINSDFLNGLDYKQARKKMIEYGIKKGWAKKRVNYKLRDWCVSRQRYWGPPIPMIKCDKCGWVPVPEKDLPVELPDLDDFHPDGTGKGPLNKVKQFVNTTCPNCQEPAKRETDVSDPFVDSSWYFFRYLNTEDDKKALNKKRIKKWMPVDMYIGGKEHTVLHLLYSRFITMVLYDFGYCDFEEPFLRFFGHGLVIKDGAKMSKSKGNVVNPDEYIERFGADSVRLYLMFLGDVSQGGDWKDSGMAGMFKFVKKIYRLYRDFEKEKPNYGFNQKELNRLNIAIFHKTVQKVTRDLDRLSFNTSIAKIMEFFNWYVQNEKKLTKKEKFLMFGGIAIMIAPFAPHLGEEFWSMLNHESSVFKQKWPKFNRSLIKEKSFELVIQINGKLKARTKAACDISRQEAVELAKNQEKIRKILDKQEIKKVIFIPKKLVNFVV
ncbi:MAG: leucine--tRNA ligase [Candidatus Moranbacteria bacterium]|nr:leucine--tRNA ligase [Candidatus Moranbacteria bacterium]